MPKELEAKLKKEARKKGLKGESANAYVFGTMRKTGWEPKRKGGSIKSHSTLYYMPGELGRITKKAIKAPFNFIGKQIDKSLDYEEAKRKREVEESFKVRRAFNIK
jgi:hypothetical protein